MDNDEFMVYWSKLDDGLMRLTENMYWATKGEIIKQQPDELIKLGKAKVKMYEELLPKLSENRQESLKKRFGHNIEEMKKHLKTLEDK